MPSFLVIFLEKNPFKSAPPALVPTIWSRVSRSSVGSLVIRFIIPAIAPPPYSVLLLPLIISKTGDEAQEWVNEHRNGLYITEEQQQALFDDVLVDEYEQRVRSQLAHFADESGTVTHDMISWEHLSEKQKHILFDFAYNPGLSKFPTLTEAVLREDWDTVAQSFERFSAGEPLSYRNDTFYQTFLDFSTASSIPPTI